MERSLFTGFIPARTKDGNLNNKNFLEFGEISLLDHKIDQLLAVKKLEKILISIDADFPYKRRESEKIEYIVRPAKFSELDCNFNSFCEYVAEIVPTSHVVWAPVTCPLVGSSLFDSAIDLFVESVPRGYDSLITCSLLKRYLLDESGPLNFRFYESMRAEAELPVLYEFINAICISATTDLKKWKYNWGKVPFKFVLPKSVAIDICDEVDYRIAKRLIGLDDEIHN